MPSCALKFNLTQERRSGAPPTSYRICSAPPTSCTQPAIPCTQARLEVGGPAVPIGSKRLGFALPAKYTGSAAPAPTDGNPAPPTLTLGPTLTLTLAPTLTLTLTPTLNHIF